MMTKTKVVLAAALVLGTASAALAGDSGENGGGYVLPGSTDGVNPVYHPDLFPNHAKGANADNGGQAYGFAPAVQQKHRVTHERTRAR